MDELVKLERRIQSIYEKALQPLASRFAYDLPVSRKDAAGLPSVLFLGNHSSGKSSFINFLLGTEIQKTGLAPTDDGFTIITYGEKADTFDGQTVVTHPDLAYRHLERLGPAFLSRLRLKTHPHFLLKSITLIDSPGMIDAAGTANTRGYDFTASVRQFAESADLILFFFDPDKPGTTGETVSIFTETLAGLEYKLLIVLNKVDLFANIRDFARTYGTLSWNLSKTIKTKDIPHIFNIYLPKQAQTPAGRDQRAIPLSDFDHSRDEVVSEIKRTPTRRADNLVSDLYKNAQKLTMHTRICHEVARRYRVQKWKLIGLVSVTILLGAGLVYLTRNAESWTTPFLIGLTGIILAAGNALVGRHFLKQFQETIKQPETLNAYFERAYRDELAFYDRADLRALWESVRAQTIKTLEVKSVPSIPCNFSTRKSLHKLEQIVRDEIPPLRRNIAEYHRQRGRSVPEEKS